MNVCDCMCVYECVCVCVGGGVSLCVSVSVTVCMRRPYFVFDWELWMLFGQ